MYAGAAGRLVTYVDVVKIPPPPIPASCARASREDAGLPSPRQRTSGAASDDANASSRDSRSVSGGWTGQEGWREQIARMDRRTLCVAQPIALREFLRCLVQEDSEGRGRCLGSVLAFLPCPSGCEMIFIAKLRAALCLSHDYSVAPVFCAMILDRCSR